MATEEKKELGSIARGGRGLFWLFVGWCIAVVAVFLIYGGLSWYHETDEHPEEMLAVTAGPKMAKPVTEPVVDFFHLGDRVDTRPPAPPPPEDILAELAKPLDSGPPNAMQQWRAKDRAAKAAAKARAAGKKPAAKK